MTLFKASTLVLLLTFHVFESRSSELTDRPDHIKQDKGSTDTLKNYTTPTQEVPLSQWPDLSDDLTFDNLDTAIERQLKRFNQRNMKGSISLGGKTYPQSHLIQTLKDFSEIVQLTKNCLKQMLKERCMNMFNQQVRSQFLLLKPTVGPEMENFAHFTAYYTPTIPAKAKASSGFNWPIYAKPTNANLAKTARADIDFKAAIANKGFELFYAPDLFELYLLHVEGGGKVSLLSENGTTDSYYISYAGTNGKRWNFISTYMKEKGYINDLSIVSQRNFLHAHPELQEEIYSTCPSYVYFKLTDTPPEGSDLVPLSDNRSIATDRNYYALKGMLAFVQTKRLRPDADDSGSSNPKKSSYMNFSRFMLDQDTGGAIKGKARVDLYFGEDEYAAKAAQHVNHPGQLYFLIKR